jgi:hypothetical protein
VSLLRQLFISRMDRLQLIQINGTFLESFSLVDRLSQGVDRMNGRPDKPLREQAAEAVRRARQLPVGPERNELRQIAIGLLWLERRRVKTSVQLALKALRLKSTD